MFRTLKPTVPAPQDRQAYIPPHVESAMAEHVQQSMPAHLKKYQGGNTYIPEHARTEITQHLENSLPPHMKQYAGAYMQQSIVEPSLARRGAVAAPAPPPEPSVTPHAPVAVTNLPNLSGQPGSAVQPSVPAPAPPQNPTAVQNVSQSPDQAYNFITNPAEQPKQSPLSNLFGSGGGSSRFLRIGVIAGSLVVLFIIFSIVKGLLSSTPGLDSFITVAEQQQELIHLVSNTNQQSQLSIVDQNLAATMQASLTSSQTAIIQYLANNHKKVTTKQLSLKISTAIDKQLADAATAGTYDQSFHDIMQTELSSYGNTLTATYKVGQGKKGQALLQENYRQLKLFQTQLNTPAD